MSPSGDFNKVGASTTTYFFVPEHAYPLGAASTWRTVVYAKFHTLSGKLVPYEVVTHYINSKRSSDFRITSVEASSNPPDDALLIPGTSEGKCPGGDGGGQVIQGLIVHKVQPEYPVSARRAGAGGIVVLHITIGKTGEIKDVQVVSSPRPDLTGSAIAAIRRYQYKPFLLDGAPVEVDGTITINYVNIH